MSKICAFTGNRSFGGAISAEEVTKRLECLLEDMIENQGFTDFRAGGAIGFDTIAALCVLKLKERYPQIKLHVYIPCKNQDKFFSPMDKKLYAAILKRADSTLVLQENYSNAAMHARNRAMIDGADHCVALLTRSDGGTFSTVNYARRKQVPVTNIYTLK